MKISADRAVNEKVICDVYSMTDDLNVSSNVLDLQNLATSLDFDHTIKSSVRPKNASSVLSVYNTTAKPTVTAATVNSVEGFLDVCALCICSDEANPISVCTEEIPFKIDMTDNVGFDDMQAEARVDVNNITYSLGVSGEIDLRIVLSCHIDAFENRRMETIDRVESKGARETDSPSIVLYFVQKGDTLWDIAKRYHTKTEYITELNGSDSTFKVVSKVVSATSGERQGIGGLSLRLSYHKPP